MNWKLCVCRLGVLYLDSETPSSDGYARSTIGLWVMVGWVVVGFVPNRVKRDVCIFIKFSPKNGVIPFSFITFHSSTTTHQSTNWQNLTQKVYFITLDIMNSFFNLSFGKCQKLCSVHVGEEIIASLSSSKLLFSSWSSGCPMDERIERRMQWPQTGRTLMAWPGYGCATTTMVPLLHNIG